MGAEAVSYQAIFEEAPTITSLKPVHSNERAVHVFPNPSDEFINVSASSMINKIEMFDLSGRSLFQQSFNDKDIKLSLNAVKAPLVILRITTEHGVYMRTVLMK
jgi:hypothetical protein